MNDRGNELEPWLRRLELRTDLSSEDRRRILTLPGTVERIRANHDFVRLHERLTAVCVVVEGLAARFGQTRDGARMLTALHIPGDAADLHSAVLPNAECAITAVTDTVILRVPHHAIYAAADASPAIARAFWRDCTVDASIAAEWLLNIGRREALARVAHILCELALRYRAIGGQRDRFALPMTQAHLGDATGLTPVHVNRMLRQLRELGLASIQHSVAEIHDWPQLIKVADFDPNYLHLAQETPAADHD